MGLIGVDGVEPTAFRPKQTLGQNFLTDENIGRKIVEAIDPSPGDFLVEIGPGFGALTRKLVESGARVLAVEIDQRLTGALREEFSGVANFELVENDFLKMDLGSIARGQTKVRIVGNIPYHITTPVMFKVFENPACVADMILMIQTEVAERVVAAPRTKAYGILSVVSQLYSCPEILFHVSRNVFRPRPEVSSSVIRWDLTRAPNLEIRDEVLLRKVIRLTFNQRRKMLRKSLQQLPDFKERAPDMMLNLERRPEELTVAEFVKLSNHLVAD